MYGPWTRSVSITWELIGNEESQAPAQTNYQSLYLNKCCRWLIRTTKPEKYCREHCMCLLSHLPSAILASQFCRLHVHSLDISIWCWGWSGVLMHAQAARQSQRRAGAFPMSNNQESGMLGQEALQSCPSWMTALCQNCQQRAVMFTHAGVAWVMVAQLTHVGIRKKKEKSFQKDKSNFN